MFFEEYFELQEVPDEATRNIMISKYRLRQFLVEWTTSVYNKFYITADHSFSDKIITGGYEKNRLSTAGQEKGKKSPAKKIVVDHQEEARKICQEVYFDVAKKRMYTYWLLSVLMALQCVKSLLQLIAL